ncbi:hypothetical protein E2553_40410 [Paraburkholderia dipogonis]|uniref:Uncharacterized protein n=1 Tax=Paraburkholderia dipogonis TaxID=1211383 RepID=A0A4Y8MJQ5_9BURK|nr:hypothetical protein [Paraburkholderia dipogonis]TFE37671.1 hypothetical protein E2553_40410 [Paraburkholderia dipogonis]
MAGGYAENSIFSLASSKKMWPGIPIVLLIAGCTVSASHLNTSAPGDAPSENKLIASDSDMILTKIALLLTHAHLDDNINVSKILDVRLAGGESETGRGDMIYACALQSYTNTKIWKGRRYRYEKEPAYFASQPFPATSKCFNPYVVNNENPAHVSASLSININVNNVCITDSDIKRHFKDAYYSESRGGFSVRYRTGDVNDHIVLRIESTRTGKICANTIVLDQNDFAPEYF